MNLTSRFALVKEYYDKGLWAKERVRDAVGRWITPAEYEKITGEPFGAPEKDNA